MLGDKHPLRAAERIGPERCRLLEEDAHRVAVDLLDLDVLVAAGGHSRRGRVQRILPVEDDIIGREGLAVVPLDALLQFPGDGLAVSLQAAVLAVGNLFRQHRHQLTFGTVSGEGLVEDARGFLIFGADGEMRVDERRPLPPQQLERATAAALGRLVVELRLRLGDAIVGEHLTGHRRREAGSHHALHKAAAAQVAIFDLDDEVAKLLLVHGTLP